MKTYLLDCTSAICLLLPAQTAFAQYGFANVPENAFTLGSGREVGVQLRMSF